MYLAMQALERAKELIARDDEQALLYASVELRRCVEHICYEKLRRHLRNIPESKLKGWQPRKVIETIKELDNPDIEKSYTLAIAVGDAQGRPTEPPVGWTYNSITGKRAGKIWQKLSSYLHVPLPHGREGPDPARMKNFLLEAAADLEGPAKNLFEGHIATVNSFRCARCNDDVVRNATLLTDGDIVTCTNKMCGMHYVIEKTANGITAKPHQTRLKCAWCGADNFIDTHELEKLELTTSAKPYTCAGCGMKHLVQLQLTYCRWESKPVDYPLTKGAAQ